MPINTNPDTYLLVPTKLDALFVGQNGQAVLEPMARFDLLPHSRRIVRGGAEQLETVNFDQPYTSETAFSRPFTNLNAQLEPGVHLHWSLPDALTIARQWTPDHSMAFPAVPNRWLVARFINDADTPDTQWMVMSDFLWPEGTEPAMISGLKRAYAKLSEAIKTQLSAKLVAKGSFVNMAKSERAKIRNYLFAAVSNPFPELEREGMQRFGELLVAAQDAILSVVLEREILLPHITYHHKSPSGPGEIPFCYQGLTERFSGDWTPPQYPDQQAVQPLLALGYGEKTYSAFYPNCRGVFGLHDANVPQDGSVHQLRYEVYGWYAQPEQEFLQAFIASFAAGEIRAELDWKETLKQAIGWSLTPEVTALPERMLCYAKLNFDPAALEAEHPQNIASSEHHAPESHRSHGGVSVAIGNTGSEAMSAYLAGRLAEQEADPDAAAAARTRIENQLESLNLRAELPDLHADMTSLFDEARHNKSFRPVSGGRLWSLQYEGATTNDQTNPQDISRRQMAGRHFLPEGLDELLDEANQLQKRFNQTNEGIRSLQRQIYSDWHQYMRASYHNPENNYLPGSNVPTYADMDAAKAHIEEMLDLLQLYQAFAGRIEYDADKHETAEAPWTAVPLYDSDTDGPLPNPAGLLRLLPETVPAFEKWLGDIQLDSTIADSNFITLQIAEHLNTIAEALHQYDELVGTFRDRQQALLDQEVWTWAALQAQANDLDNWYAIDFSGTTPPVSNTGTALASLTGDDKETTGRQLLLDALQPLAALPILHLAPAVAPRYWQPKEPVLLLAGPLLETTDRHGMDNDNGYLPCHSIAFDTGTTLAGEDRRNEFLPIFTSMIDSNDAGWNDSGLNPWHPLFFEWEVALHPISLRGNINDREKVYDPYFMSENYELKDQNSDYTERRDPSSANSSSYFSGRSVLTPFAEAQLLEQIEQYIIDLARHYRSLPATDTEGLDAPIDDTGWLAYFVDKRTDILAHFDTEHGTASAQAVENHDSPVVIEDLSVLHTIVDAWDMLHNWRQSNNEASLDRHFIQTQALSGFNEALQMLHQSIQLEVAEPNGFKEYSDFSRRVGAAVGGRNLLAAMPNVDFHPLRTGDLSLYRLRLVDTFGRAYPIADQTNDQYPMPQIYAPERMVTGDAGTVRLPPRIAQPAKLDFRWLAADNPNEETNSHPDTSPICGWVMINNLDNSLMVYAPGGNPLGYLDRLCKWRVFPGKDAPLLVENIENAAMRKMLQWFMKINQYFLEGQLMPILIDYLERIMEHIDPASYAQHPARSLLMGRPMVLVQASVDLMLKGWPAVQQDTPGFKRVVAGQAYESDDFTKVQFPIRIGEKYRLDDGLVGYWIDEDDGYAVDRLFTPIDSLLMRQTIADAAQRLTILMDPRGLVHCSAGVLPTKALSIPKEHYAQALEKLQVSFITAPILSDPGHMHLNLPDEPGFSWSWIERNGDNWHTLTQKAKVRRADVLSAFDQGASIWQLLLDKGWIALPGGSTDIADLRLPNQRTEAQLLPDDPEGQANVEQVLGMIALGIVPAYTDARFGPTAAIREGWMSLHPTAGAWDT